MMRTIGVVALGIAGLLVTGCGSDEAAAARVATWYGGIQPLLVEKCGACHTAGGAGPFALDTYGEAAEMAAPALRAVETNVMPPWGAQDTDECTPPLPWKNDLRLSDADKQLLRAWVSAGAPLGDPSTALPVPQPPGLALEGATIERAFQQAFVVRNDKHDIFECFVLDPQVTEPSWITGVQVTPGNRRVAHHALVFLDNNAEADALATDGHFPCFSNPDIDVKLVGAWAPGALPFETPVTSGIPVKPGARLVVQMHYHPTAVPEADQSSVSVRTTTTKPIYDAQLALLGNFSRYDAAKGTGLMPGPGDVGGEPEFRIPAGAAAHVETMTYVQNDVPIAVPIFAVGAHMHYVGVDMKIEHTLSGIGSDDKHCLLQTPKWDFNWQRGYVYDAPIDELPTVRPGDTLTMRCTYNNTMNNPFVVDALREQGLSAPVDVRLGEQTLDEMCLAVIGALVPAGLLPD